MVLFTSIFSCQQMGKGFQSYSLEVVVANIHHSTSPCSCLYLGLLRSPDIVLKYIYSFNGKSTLVASVLMHLILQGCSSIIPSTEEAKEEEQHT